MSDRSTSAKKAIVYRMVMPEHVCPYGLKTVDLLKREGFEIEDHHLETREETDAFKEKHGVKTTPQTFIGGERIGGYDDLREHFGKSVKKEDETSYQPVIAVRYGFIYPFGEALAGILMVAHALPIVSVPVSLFIGTVGAVSVFKAVYIEKRELKCACVGGNSNVPLGFISLTENLMMILMGLWMGRLVVGG